MAVTKHVMALDVGERRIGVALASLDAQLPSPHGVIDPLEVPAAVVRLIDTYNVTALIIGLPRGLEGQETAQTKAVRQFKDKLTETIDIPCYFQDEALTSIEAKTELEERKARYTKEAVDALAATFILRDWLSEQRKVVV